MPRTETALQAVTTHDVALGGHQVAYGEQTRRVSVRSELGDCPGELVAYNDRRPQALAGPAIPLPDVKVGAAHACVMNSDQRLVGTAGGDRNLPEDDAGTGGLFDQRAHGGSGGKVAGNIRRERRERRERR